MCDYPFFIPQVVLFANSSLFWFKVTNEHREFRNYLFIFQIFHPFFHSADCIQLLYFTEHDRHIISPTFLESIFKKIIYDLRDLHIL